MTTPSDHPPINWAGTDGLTADEVIHLIEMDLESVGSLRARAAENLERAKSRLKSAKAEAMLAAQAWGVDTVAGQEREAYASEKWKKAADTHAKCVRFFDELDSQYWALKTKIEVWREHQANERAKMRLY